jgi:calcineurin-like phosphoesterase family protein
MNQHMDCRGFDSWEEMNAHMIEKWNKRVRKNDEVVVLGDFSVGKGAETNEILRQLNGRKYLIEGNHDGFLKDKEFDVALFKWIKPYAELNDNKRKVVLCHYPVFCYNGQYRVNQEGEPKVYMLYGHVHNTYDEVLIQSFQKQTRETKRELRGKEGLQSIPCNMINCFCMFSDYTPLTLDEWIGLAFVRKKQEYLK